jgi:hypothetical protein
VRSTKLKQSINAIWTSLDYICRVNLPALNSELELKGKLKFRRKCDNKAALSFFSLILLFQMSKLSLSHTAQIRAHCDHKARIGVS